MYLCVWVYAHLLFLGKREWALLVLHFFICMYACIPVLEPVVCICIRVGFS